MTASKIDSSVFNWVITLCASVILFWYHFFLLIFRKRFENFAQLVRDEAYAMGCAMARLKIDNEFITLFTCDYSVSIVLNKPIYKIGKKSASGCKKGKNTDYPGLCDIKEIYDHPDYYNWIICKQLQCILFKYISNIWNINKNPFLWLFSS